MMTASVFKGFYLYVVSLFVTLSLPSISRGASGKHDSIKFYHYVDVNTPVRIREDDLSNLKFQWDEPTFVIVDGFLSNMYTNMTQSTKDGLLKQRPNSNVVVVDWGKLSGSEKLQLDEKLQLSMLMLVYNEVASKVDLVGQKLATVLHKLVQHNLTDYSKMHVIAYSLGAHIAGVAGINVIEKYFGRITRITGLDPAGPRFSLRDRKKRLDKTDAEFVDVYFTSKYTTGDFEQDVGHVDIYVNGGSRQPGCAGSLTMSTICNHSYSYRMWNECLRTNCVACPCHPKQCQMMGGKDNCLEKVDHVGINISMEKLLPENGTTANVDRNGWIE